MYYCKYCGRETNRKCANTYHENRCVNNPNVSFEKICPNCNKQFRTKDINAKFCCLDCSSHYSGNKSHKHTNKLIKKTKNCKDCGNKIGIKNKSGYCRNCISKYRNITEETKQKLSEAGKKSANTKHTRSKNEILFYDLLKDKFPDILHNVPMFNSWDADIIIPSKNIAILWNGRFHYEDIFGQLKQIQNRDKIKYNEIVKSGYMPYIVVDLKKHSKSKCETELKRFDIFLNILYNLDQK